MHRKDNDVLNKIIKKAALVAGTAGATLLAGCTFNPAINEEPAVYGPPPGDDIIIEEPVPFSPKDNEEREVYGPPEMFEDLEPDENIDEDPEEDSEEDSNIEPTDEPEIFAPDENMPVLIYGPPEMFENEPVDGTLK